MRTATLVSSALFCAAILPGRADIVPPKPQLAEAVPAKPESPAAPVSGTFDSAPYRLRREAKTPASDAGFFRIPVDAELYRHSGRDFAALRLAAERNGSLIGLPWIIRPVPRPAAPSRPERLFHRIESFEEAPDHSIELVVALADGSPAAARLEIATPLRDFEKGVTVSIPGEGGSWSVLVGDAFVFDHTRFLDFRHTTVTLPETQARRFRIRIADATDEQRSRVREITRTVGEASGTTVSETSRTETRSFRVDELRFHAAPEPAETGDPDRERHVLALLSQETTAGGETELLLDGGNLPLDRIAFTTESRNFRRPVSIQIPAEGDTWRTVHRGTLHVYDVGGFHDESLSLAVPGFQSDRYRIVVENGENPPVVFAGASGETRTRDLVFLADPGDRPVVFLGGDDATLTKPSLDTAAIDAALSRSVRAATLLLGETTSNPANRDIVPPGPSLLESRGVLWSVIAVAVAVLIAALYGALRKIDASGGDGGTEG
ncbi:MAG: DUF3999 family protein [Verrucomicrobia bacterium]|nr:DUF3999 family protein [Verrucomicrobiota bacterium]